MKTLQSVRLSDDKKLPSARPGTLERMTYSSNSHDPRSLPLEKEALVYLPYGYEADPARRYPVMILTHGGGGNSDEWFGGLEGKSPLKNILDQMIAEGELQPLILVTPTFYYPGTESALRDIEKARMLTENFHKEVTQDLIPAIDCRYRTIPDRDHRAFGGFSMGSETTWNMLVHAPSAFRWYLPISGDYWLLGIKAGKTLPAETCQAMLAILRAAGYSGKDFGIFAATGTGDIAFEAMEPLVSELIKQTDWFTPAADLKNGNLVWCLSDGVHSYDYGYDYLAQALPMFFGRG